MHASYLTSAHVPLRTHISKFASLRARVFLCIKVFGPSHKVASRRVLKAIESGDAGVRQTAVGALGSIHQIGHWRYFTQEWNPAQKKAEERSQRIGRDGGLMTGVINRLFHINQGTRLSASCAIMEMCSMCKEEQALSPTSRSV